MQQSKAQEGNPLDLLHIPIGHGLDCFTPEQYKQIFISGHRPDNFLPNVCGRVIRGRTDQEFEKLSYIEDRRVTFIFGPEGMGSLVGVPAREIVLSTGKTPDWLSDQISAGMKWKLVVFPKSSCTFANWEGVYEMIQRYYPEVVNRISNWYEAMRDSAIANSIDKNLVTSAVKDNPSHPEHRNVLRYMNGGDTLVNARLFLWHSLGINDQFTGTGFTKLPNGDQGQEEYLIENTLISEIPDYRILDLDVK